MRQILLLILVIVLVSCAQEKDKKLKVGVYHIELEVQDDEQLAFNFEVTSDDKIKIFNAEEVIDVDQITYKNDSVYVNFSVYEGYFAAAFDGDNLKGNYIKESLDRVVPFYAEYGNNIRFETDEVPTVNFSGIWEMLFTEDDGSTFIARGNFTQKDHKLTGNIRTTTGDYRYLEGVVNGDEAKFSAFDGAHAFLFTAKITNSEMQGAFYSGNHYKSTFTAIQNESYELPHEDSLTYLNEGFEKFEFNFPDASNNMMSLKDERFNNKVVLVQIMGTWCPNCLDESTYFTNYYKENKALGLEIVALAFEYATTKEKAFAGIERLQKRLDIQYPILLAQYGSSDKKEAQEKLPMLNHVLSYPTTIFIDKKGKVRKIHTGFNGPATGEKFLSFQKEFDDFVQLLLAE